MTYPITIVTAPVNEPVTVLDAKAQSRVDITDDDDLIYAQIVAARELCELQARRAFVTQTLAVTLDAWPANGIIELPRPPLQSVTSIKYTDEDGNQSTFASSNYIVDTANNRVVLKSSATWPSDVLQRVAAILVTFVAGYGTAADVPTIYKQAILLTIGHWYENREAVVVERGVNIQELPIGVNRLLGIDRGGWF